MKTIYDKHISKRTLPINLTQEDQRLFAREFSKEIDKTTLTKLTNAHILKDAIFSIRKFRFYLSHSHIHALSKKALLKRFLVLFSSKQKCESAIWIIDNWSEAYFHWLTDALTRLVSTEQFIKTKVVVLPKEFEKSAYIAESLKLLNYKIYFYSEKLLVKKLILPSHTAPTGNYNKEIINTLRNRFLKNINGRPERNIYVSRKKANKRKVLNEIEVIFLMKQYDYEVHFFEDYDLKKQIELMSQTKRLVGLHGAGLTNMLFMPKDGCVLELRNRNDAHNNCFFTLASDLNHRYYYQLNDGNTKDTHIVDITVDLEELRINLEMLKNETCTAARLYDKPLKANRDNLTPQYSY